MSDAPNINIEGTNFGGDFVTGDKTTENIAQQVQGDVNTESNEVIQNVNGPSPFDGVRKECETDEQKEYVDKLEGFAEVSEEGATDNQREVVGGLVAELKSKLQDNAPRIGKLLLSAAESLAPKPAGLLATLVKNSFFPE